MKQEYEKAIQKMRELKENVSEEKWNKIAQKNNLLSSVSLEYISQKDFDILQKELRAR